MSDPKSDALPLGYARLLIGLQNRKHVAIISYCQGIDKMPIALKFLFLISLDFSLLHKLLKIEFALEGNLTEEMLRQDTGIIVGFVLSYPQVFKMPAEKTDAL